MRLLSSIGVFAWALASCAWAKSAQGDRVLVVLEDATEKGLYSQFWADLEARQFELTFQSPKSDDLSLFKLGAPAYDHLILLPPKSKGYGPNLAPKSILEFTNAGGNILLALSNDPGTPSAISSLLLEYDLQLPTDRNALVVDHFNYDTSSTPENHDVLLVSRPGPMRPDVADFFGGSGMLAVPKAVGQTLGVTSPLLAPILKAPATAYMYNPKDTDAESADDVAATGSQISLVSSVQARNNARLTVLGSLDMLKDKWFDAKVQLPGGKSTKTVNRDFATQLTEWTFKEVGVLKAGHVEYHEVLDAAVPLSDLTHVGFADPDIIRIKTDVSYSIELSTYDKSHWAPYTPPAADSVQLEFSMLSPFHRIPLTPVSTTSNSTIFSASFRTPDKHGIFAFKVNYKRPFLTNVDERRQVTVRHFAHDEWPRSFVITAAWPWLTGLWTVVAGFLIFVVGWLYCEPPKKQVRS